MTQNSNANVAAAACFLSEASLQAAQGFEKPWSSALAPACPTDWKEQSAYAHLATSGPTVFAWEWLRRSRGYRLSFDASVGAGSTDRLVPPSTWGVCAYADPDLDHELARPMWHSSIYPSVLPIDFSLGPDDEQVDLANLVGGPLTIVAGPGGLEHCLFMKGGGLLRFDLKGGCISRGPFLPRFNLAGRGAARWLPLVEKFLEIARSGRTSPSASPCHWARRRILELRARDALACGASHRDLAAVLVDEDAMDPSWRVGLASVRSRAQRLAKAAMQMESGGWTALLTGRPLSAPHVARRAGRIVGRF